MKDTPQTILTQLGAMKFIAMTGARDFVRTEDSLQFSLPRGAKLGINRVAIELNAEDTYDITYYKVCSRTDKISGLMVYGANEISSHCGLYAEQLAPSFFLATGLRTAL